MPTFPPCIVAGAGRADAPRQLPSALPRMLPFMPETGRRSSSSTTTTWPGPAEATLGQGEPGVYNLAGEGTITLCDLARALGWFGSRCPGRSATPPSSSPGFR